MAKTDLLPDSINDDRFRALAQVIDGPGDLDLSVVYLQDIDALPDHLLPDILIDRGLVDLVTEDMPPETVRRLLKDSRFINKKRGTPAAVKRALGSIGVKADYLDWHKQQPEGAPNTFKIIATLNENVSDTGGPVITPEKIAQMDRLTAATARESQAYTIEVSSQHTSNMAVGAGFYIYPAVLARGEL